MFVMLAPVTAIAQGTLYTLIDNGPRSNRVNIVILAEGYTAAQEAQFVIDADQMAQYVMVTPPWSAYASYMNAFAIFVASLEAGADHPAGEGLFRDTYFNSTYDSYGIERLITIPPNDYDGNSSNGSGKVYSLLSQHLPEYDIVVLLVNDPQYGGSGGAFAISSMNGAAPEIVVHELGHSFADLGDEYETAYPGYPDIEDPNTTQQTVRELIKWNTWIEPSTPIPTPQTSGYASVVGLFEGAHYHSLGWYRPELDCEMRSLYRSFCAICTEEIIKAQYAGISTIISSTPVSPVVNMTTVDVQEFSVTTLVPSSHTLTVTWLINDVPIPGENDPTILIAGSTLGVGTVQIKAVVHDPTPMVRIDPLSILTDETDWFCTVTQGCLCDCHGDPQCDGVTNVLDVVGVVNVAFRGQAPVSDPVCPNTRTDIDCSGATDVLDVVNVVNVAFRGANAAVVFCDPCAP
jgi:hypothetical protein